MSSATTSISSASPLANRPHRDSHKIATFHSPFLNCNHQSHETANPSYYFLSASHSNDNRIHFAYLLNHNCFDDGRTWVQLRLETATWPTETSMIHSIAVEQDGLHSSSRLLRFSIELLLCFSDFECILEMNKENMNSIFQWDNWMRPPPQSVTNDEVTQLKQNHCLHCQWESQSDTKIPTMSTDANRRLLLNLKFFDFTFCLFGLIDRPEPKGTDGWHILVNESIRFGIPSSGCQSIRK